MAIEESENSEKPKENIEKRQTKKESGANRGIEMKNDGGAKIINRSESENIESSAIKMK